jgi:hypothetical protein
MAKKKGGAKKAASAYRRKTAPSLHPLDTAIEKTRQRVLASKAAPKRKQEALAILKQMQTHVRTLCEPKAGKAQARVYAWQSLVAD